MSDQSRPAGAWYDIQEKKREARPPYQGPLMRKKFPLCVRHCMGAATLNIDYSTQINQLGDGISLRC